MTLCKYKSLGLYSVCFYSDLMMRFKIGGLNLMGMFLFVTANSNEKAAFEKYYKCSAERYIRGKTYYIGQFGRYDAAYIHIDEQGVTNPAAIPLVGELVRILNPIAVVMAGIAFGADENKQKIGDVLVSKRILPYDSQKFLETGTHYKETPKDVGFQLLNAFSSPESWGYFLENGKKSNVFIGSILTGSKLINNYGYRTKLLTDFDAYNPIGGEMEAYGIYSICKLYGVTEWIIVKGICDWGYNKNNPNKEQDQKAAALAAVDYCYNVFNRDGVFDDLTEKIGGEQLNEQSYSKNTTVNHGSVEKQIIFTIDKMNGNISL